MQEVEGVKAKDVEHHGCWIGGEDTVLICSNARGALLARIFFCCYFRLVCFVVWCSGFMMIGGWVGAGRSIWQLIKLILRME